jgi:flavin-dependent dehydrogenase
MTNFDVCVVGGGPSGAAAASVLAKYTSRKICLIEATTYGTWRIGETVSAAIVPLLAYLGADGLLDGDMAVPAHGTAAAWGDDRLRERHSIFSAAGSGLHLDRRRFDKGLSESVAALGATMLEGVNVRRIDRTEDGWILAGDSGESLRTRLVIDATGRAARIARRLGAERRPTDRLVGIVCLLERPEGVAQDMTLVEAVPDGWWYSAGIPGNRLVVALMTDADLVKGLAVDEPASFFERLGRTAYVGRGLAGAEQVSGPIVFPAESQRLNEPIGPGWIAAGDAACSFDPLASIGIGHAIASGIQAARIVNGLLNGDDALALSYAADIAKHAAVYAAQSRTLYRSEGRWPDAAFWSRRRH